mgnify:CR=1 FL=1
MRKLFVLALVGLASQLVDGALGMGYGVTSSSLLLLAGLGPALTSACVHLSEIGTTLISGTAHHRLGNTDWRLVARLGLPGAAGALLGAVVLSHLSTEAAAPMASSLLLALGLYVLVRFAVRPPAGSTVRRSPHSVRFLALLGLVGGFVDATGGGGWGPPHPSRLPPPLPPSEPPARSPHVPAPWPPRRDSSQGWARPASAPWSWEHCWPAVLSRRRSRPGWYRGCRGGSSAARSAGSSC